MMKISINPFYRTIAFVCVASFFCTSCGKPGQPGRAKAKEACTLLTTAEVEAIQGSPVKETKSSGNANGGLQVGQCFYTTNEFSKSVSLAITQADTTSSAPRDARAYWKEAFSASKTGGAEREEDREKQESLRKQKAEAGEEEAARPTKVSGLGDDAYWTSNRFGGALYVLKGDAFLRISVGGADNEEAKLAKSKALAEKALARM